MEPNKLTQLLRQVYAEGVRYGRRVQQMGDPTDLINKYVGVDRQLVVDTDQHRVHVMDGVTPGGHPMARLDEVQYEAQFPGGVVRSFSDKLSDIVSVKDFGAKGDGVTDDTAAIVAASDAAKAPLLFPGGDYLVTVASDDTLEKVITALNGATLCGSVRIKITGHRTSRKPLVVNCAGGENLHITGEYSDVTIASVGESTGTPGAYSLDIELTEPSSAVVGDVLVIRGDACTVGTGEHEVLRGAWRITSVSGSTITVTNTCWRDTFPKFSLTSAYGFVLHSVITFENCDGVIVKGATLGELDKVAVAGNASTYWLSSNVSGTEKSTNGVYVGGPTVAANGNLDNENALGLTNACASLGRYTAVLDFDQQGIVCTKGASIYARFVTSSSNRRRGWYAELNGSIWNKNSVSSGNFLDGYIADVGGAMMCNLSTSAGNGGVGFSCITNGILQNSTCVSSANKTDGFHVAGSGVMFCATSTAKGNGAVGFFAEYGGAILGDGSSAEGNGGDGFRATCLGSIRVLDCKSTDNGRYGLYASVGGVINTSTEVTLSGNAGGDVGSASLGVVSTGGDTAGLDIPYSTVFSKTPELKSSELKLSRADVGAIRLYLSTIGDFGVYNDTGTLLTIKKDASAAYPGADGTTALGRSSNRWAEVFAATGSINTSDEREKTAIQDPDEALMRAWGKVNFKVFQFKDAVAKKGDGARLHVGVIAQQILEAFSSEGLDATRYGVLCYDKWDDQYEDFVIIDREEVRDASGVVVSPAVTHVETRKVLDAGDRWAVRYDEAAVLEAMYQRWRLDKLEKAVAALTTPGPSTSDGSTAIGVPTIGI